MSNQEDDRSPVTSTGTSTRLSGASAEISFDAVPSTYSAQTGARTDQLRKLIAEQMKLISASLKDQLSSYQKEILLCFVEKNPLPYFPRTSRPPTRLWKDVANKLNYCSGCSRKTPEQCRQIWHQMVLSARFEELQDHKIDGLTRRILKVIRYWETQKTTFLMRQNRKNKRSNPKNFPANVIKAPVSGVLATSSANAKPTAVIGTNKGLLLNQSAQAPEVSSAGEEMEVTSTSGNQEDSNQGKLPVNNIQDKKIITMQKEAAERYFASASNALNFIRFLSKKE